MINISIIIPVFNVETYLNKCIDSILHQTYSNFEILLIDDGSTDNSGLICDYYASIDCRIRVFHKKNEGVSIARNWGIEKAKGSWICFVDSDDYIRENTLEEISKYINDSDIIQFGFLKFDHYTNEIIYESHIPTTSISIDNKSYYSMNFFHSAVCGYIIKKTIIKENNINFPTNIRYGEDQAFIVSSLLYCKNITILNKHLYYYRYRDNSAMNSGYTIDRAYDHLKVIEYISDFIKSKNIVSSKLFQNRFIDLIHSYFYIAIRSISRFEEINTIKHYYNDYCKRIKTSNNNIYKLSKCYNTYFIIYIYYIYIKIKQTFFK